MAAPLSAPRRAALLTLGCARNEVDSEELAGRLAGTAGSWSTPTDEPDVIVVNTCGFVEQAKKDSIDTLLAASDVAGGAKVVAVGCLAERYGEELADSLPEADAVLGFDDYPELAERARPTSSAATRPPRTPPSTGARCCRSRRSSGPRPRDVARARPRVGADLSRRGSRTSPVAR